MAQPGVARLRLRVGVDKAVVAQDAIHHRGGVVALEPFTPAQLASIQAGVIPDGEL